MSQIEKKRKEKEIADFFADHLNTTTGSDFKASSDQDDEEHDCILVSESNPKKKINLQIVMCDKVIIKAGINAKKAAAEQLKKEEKEIIKADIDTEKIDGIISFTPKIKENIIEAIHRKDEHYPKDIKKDTVLVVWSDMGKFNSSYLQEFTKEACKNSDFKEIFYVKPPSPSSNVLYPQEPGSVIKLK